MIYKVLTQEQTNIWLSNVDNTIDLMVDIKDQMLGVINERSKQAYLKHYDNWWSKHILDIHSIDDIWLSYDGVYKKMTPFLSTKKFTKIPALSKEEMNLNDFMYTSQFLDMYKLLKETQEKWSKYAKQPFEIDGADLELYFRIKSYHTKMKSLMQGVAAYNETRNLDEDSEDGC